MADHEHRALVFEEPVFEKFQRFGVKVVGWLVKDKDIGWYGKQFRQKQAVALTAGESS